MKKRSQKEQILIVAGLVISTVFFYASFYSKKSAKVSELQREEVALREKIKQSQNVLAQLQKIPMGDVATSSEAVKSLESNTNFAKLLRTMSGDGHVFTVNRLSVAKQEDLKMYHKTLFILEIETPFLNLGKFIDTLEHSELLLEVKSLEVNRIARELKKCTAKIELYGYVARRGT